MKFDYRLGGWGPKRSKYWLRNIWTVPNPVKYYATLFNPLTLIDATWGDRHPLPKTNMYSFDINKALGLEI